MDPVASLNAYTYASNNTIVKFDPNGRNPLLIAALVGARWVIC